MADDFESKTDFFVYNENGYAIPEILFELDPLIEDDGDGEVPLMTVLLKPDLYFVVRPIPPQ